jgi:hypothetical protein
LHDDVLEGGGQRDLLNMFALTGALFSGQCGPMSQEETIGRSEQFELSEQESQPVPCPCGTARGT